MSTAIIPLSRGLFALIDEADLSLVQGRKWQAGGSKKCPYAVHSYHLPGVGKRQLAMHRAILTPPEGEYVDHINGDGLDNRRSNIRIVSPRENQFNIAGAQTNSKTGVLNVAPKGGRFQVWLRVNGRNRCFGTYPTLEEAALVAYQARLLHFGPQAVARLPQPAGLASQSEVAR